MFDETLPMEIRVLLGLVGLAGAFMLADSVQEWNDIDNEQLERSVAYTAQSFQDAPVDVRRTDLGVFNAAAHGTTLVMTLDKVPSGNDSFDPRMIRGFVYAMICDGEVLEGLIAKGATVRFEATTNTGKALEPVNIKECP